MYNGVVVLADLGGGVRAHQSAAPQRRVAPRVTGTHCHAQNLARGPYHTRTADDRAIVAARAKATPTATPVRRGAGTLVCMRGESVESAGKSESGKSGKSAGKSASQKKTLWWMICVYNAGGLQHRPCRSFPVSWQRLRPNKPRNPGVGRKPYRSLLIVCHHGSRTACRRCSGTRCRHSTRSLRTTHVRLTGGRFLTEKG